MEKHPQEFRGICAMVALRPVSARPFIERATEGAGITDGLEIFDAALGHALRATFLNGHRVKSNEN
jgi:hypothetical protein